MTILKGISLIIHDDMGPAKYYLIMERNTSWKGWEFPKGILSEGETEEDAIHRVVKEKTGINRYKIVKKLDVFKEFQNNGNVTRYDFFLLEANMNTPVKPGKKHSTWHWSTKDRVAEKLTHDSDKKAFLVAMSEFKR